MKHNTQPMTAAEFRIFNTKKDKTKSHQKEALKNSVTLFCKINNFTLEEEKVFYKGRKWRFDFFIPQLNVAIEYEGIKTFGAGDKSRHTTITGYTGDAEKYNHAALLGIKVLRFTFKNHGTVLDYLNKIKQNEKQIFAIYKF